MPRRRKVTKRALLPDPKYKSVLVTRFVNNLMQEGKKSVAELIFYRAIENIENRTGQSGLEVFHKAIENVKPVVEVKSRRVGGATYQVGEFARSLRLPSRLTVLQGPRRQWETRIESMQPRKPGAA